MYEGTIPFDVQEIDPRTLGRPRTQIMLNAGNPEHALHVSLLPSDGVGLARMEFVFASWVGVHPLALTRYRRCRERAEADRYADRRIRGQDALLRRAPLTGHRDDRRRVPPAPRHSPLQRLQDERVREAHGRRVVRAERGEPDARLAWREPLLPPELQGGLSPRVRGGEARARGVRAHEPEADDPVLPHARGRQEGARDDARSGARSRRDAGSRCT